MTSIIHVMHASTRAQRPLLAAVAAARCHCDGGRIVTIGGPVAHPRDAHLHDSPRVHMDLERWASQAGANMVIGWGARMAAVVARLDCPGVVVLDGLPEQRVAVTAVQWLGDCRTPVLVMSPALASVLDEATQRRAVVHVMPPAVQGVQTPDAPVAVSTLHVVAEPRGAHLLRPVLDMCTRQRLVGRSWCICAEPGFADDDIAESMLQQVGMPMQWELDGPAPGLAVAASMRGGRQACAPVLPAVAAWASGATVLLPRGHAADSWLTPLGGVVNDVDGDQSASARALDSVGSTADRSRIIDGWCQASGACFDAVIESMRANSDVAASA